MVSLFFPCIEDSSGEGGMFRGVQRCSLYEDGAKDDTSTIRASSRQETVTGSHFELSNINEWGRALNYQFSSLWQTSLLLLALVE